MVNTHSLLAVKADTLFYSDEIINIELRCDFTAIQGDRMKNPQYHEGELIYISPGGGSTKLSVRLMARGVFRRDPENCKFPPLLVNFRKPEVKNTLFDNQDKLKLVTPCHIDEDVVEEYILYKMYNIVTDLSFKVRLVKILYFDTGRGKKLFEKYSFFIEDDKHLADRNNSSIVREMKTPFDLNTEILKKMSVFEYMIGNKDWFITSKKNVVLLKHEVKLMDPYAVPYDFDFAGFVNADYTKPRGIPDAHLAPRRIYKGICYTDGEFKDIFEFYRKLRPAFESVITDMKITSNYSRDHSLMYISHFYDVIADSELFKKEFLEVCETRKDYNLPEK